MKRKHRRLSSVLRARRAVRALRLSRLAHGLEATVEEEEALLGAVYLEPGMLKAVARERPPEWWIDEGSLLIFEALLIRWRGHCGPITVDMDATISEYERRGGKSEVAAHMRQLVAPRPALEEARAWLAELRRRLPVEGSPTVPTTANLIEDDGQVVPTGECHPRQLELFAHPSGAHDIEDFIEAAEEEN